MAETIEIYDAEIDAYRQITIEDLEKKVAAGKEAEKALAEHNKRKKREEG